MNREKPDKLRCAAPRVVNLKAILLAAEAC